jgi:hypothetical protein
VDFRFSLFGPVSFLGGAAYRHLFAVRDRHRSVVPAAVVDGPRRERRHRIELGRSFEIRLMGALQRYGFSFNPEPGDAQVAGGATDTYLSGGLWLAWRL